MSSLEQSRKMSKYSIEIKLRGMIQKIQTVTASNALSAINQVCSLYPVGPYEFTARKVG